jgi:transposase
MLEGYAGILQVDGYAVYEKLFGNHPDILLVYCMAHPRRKFVDALKYDKERSTYVLERMQVLYALEQQMREEKLDWEEKTKLRQDKSVPILLELKDWMT